MNMGHGDQVLSSPVQNNLFEDGLLWLGRGGKLGIGIPGIRNHPFRAANRGSYPSTPSV